MILFEHQRAGADYLEQRSHAYLGDVPGLGKTRTLLEAVRRTSPTTFLVACPAIVRSFWEREATLMDLGDRIVVRSYDQLVRGSYALMAELAEGRSHLILDEAHYLKHVSAERTRVTLGKNGYSRRIPTVYAASGTPVPRNPLEYWPVLSSLFPEVALQHGIRTASQFKEHFVVMRRFRIHDRWIEKPVGARNLEEFRHILDATMLRRTLDDVGVDVPTMFWQPLVLDASDVAPVEPLSREQVEGAKFPLETFLSDPHVARYRRNVGEAKVKPVVEMLTQELAAGDEKVVVFAYHRSVLEGLRKGLGPFGVAYIDGSVSPTDRDQAIGRFQTDPKCRVFLGQNIACQTGITLHAAHRLVLVEPEWAEDVNVQLGQRVARIGSTFERCIGQRVCLAGTLDEWIVRQNLREGRLQTEMFEKEIV